ncbi:MAG: type II secretion system protein [Candidatus Omnitrophica bacterium]|nr:type II secretion system protein [Candidatus Omnitrophota bacterium]
MSSRPAFTLIELTLVAVIILVLLGLSTPLFKRSFSDLAVKDAAYNISKLINYIQEKAVLETKAFKLVFDFEKGRYRVLEASPSAGQPEKKITGRFGRIFDLPQGVSFKAPKNFITFYPDGHCDEVDIDVFARAGIGYKISAKGFGSLTRIKEIKDAE